MKTLIRTLLGGTAAVAVAAFSLVPSAQAACFWTGYGWNCAAPPVYAAAPYWAPYGYAPAHAYNYGGDYDQIPNDYPGPSLTGEGY